MPCDRLQLLLDYARLCVQMPGDSYGTARQLLGHFAHSLNLPYALFLTLDPTRTQIILSCGSPDTPNDVLALRPLAETSWAEVVGLEGAGPCGADQVFPVRDAHGMIALLVCRPSSDSDFCEADRDVAEVVSHALRTLLVTDDGSAQPSELPPSEQLLREFQLLYQVSRALHGTLNLDALTHLVLSAAVLPDAGGFERAMLFTVNERTGILQGMLGISRGTVLKAWPAGANSSAINEMPLDAAIVAEQRGTPLNRKVIKQRLPLEDEENPVSRAYASRQIVRFPSPDQLVGSARHLVNELQLGPCACAPLAGRHRSLGVLLVDNPESREAISQDSLLFLELFANQAGDALENARLVRRLERAHEDLREVQERLIQGEKLAVLGEMAAQVAHELKNPLVSIGGFAQRLERRDLGDPRSNEYAGIIAREVRRLEEMLGNILAFSKKQLVCLEECSLLDLMDEALELEENHMARSGITVEKQVIGTLPEITGDCSQLRQVFLNLLINARQAMPEGGRVTIRMASCGLRGEPAVEIEVEDTGGGIPSEMIRNIFNPFFSTNPKGTGLGLSISHRIVEHHHGELEVVNGEQGACFIVRLPLQPVPRQGR